MVIQFKSRDYDHSKEAGTFPLLALRFTVLK